jgi:hypothetical protein
MDVKRAWIVPICADFPFDKRPHSGVSTVMGYTRQEALDIHQEWEKKSPGVVAKEALA